MTAVSIVIPAYNEEARLLSSLEAVLGYLRQKQDLSAEVLVVNDGSTDGTHDVAQAFAGREVRVRVIDNPGNRGKGYSVRHGVMESSSDWVLFSDADLSAPIEELDKLLWEARRQDADVAIGSRAVDRSLIGVHQSVFRENAGRIFNLLMRVFTGLPFSDTQCGFKLFSKKAAKEIFSRQRIERFGFDAEVLFIARLRGFKTIEVPVRWNHVEGTKVSMLGDSLNMFLDLVRIRANQIKGLYR